MLSAGISYEELSDIFVLFICEYDLFEKGLYRYTCRTKCEEDELLEYEGGCRTIYLSTHRKNVEKVPSSLGKFLKVVVVDIKQREQDFGDEHVERFRESVHTVKKMRNGRRLYDFLEK